ncbi:tumor necrosis factor receptor superfamily member 25 [Cottoperca gobio]|uniref:Tumor necrosis factor receptor superfamily member 25 n=1 Tax=Cottoperca gobio TaxID=56716 RepID=A0A6J2Q156_COTGO|nr:tumor necrosis factor receptor superfamily member 25-like [Cottoperca gobio]
MDFVLVYTLILALLSIGQSCTEGIEKNDSCYEVCPPGYYHFGNCDDQAAKYRCKKCGTGTFTAIKNTAKACIRCGVCGNFEVVKTQCTCDSDVKCDCIMGYYYNGNPSIVERACRKCNSKYCKEIDTKPDYKRNCQSFCQSKECLELPAPAFPPSPNISTAATIPTSSRIYVIPAPKNKKEMVWQYPVLVVGTILVFLGLVLCVRNLFANPDKCLCWSVNKDLELPVEDPKFNEQRSHQDSSPNTLTFSITEETPMMTLNQSPATPEHPAHSSALVPDGEHKAAKQNEQSEHWPAIVLYTIIKEVPLRRWKEFLRLLSVTDQQLERVELEAGLGLGSIERQYQMLRLWSQCSSASLNNVFSALDYMDLSGCAQLLQENLEKLQWKL